MPERTISGNFGATKRDKVTKMSNPGWVVEQDFKGPIGVAVAKLALLRERRPLEYERIRQAILRSCKILKSD